MTPTFSFFLSSFSAKRNYQSFFLLIYLFIYLFIIIINITQTPKEIPKERERERLVVCTVFVVKDFIFLNRVIIVSK